jgi:hypothetical protein
MDAIFDMQANISEFAFLGFDWQKIIKHLKTASPGTWKQDAVIIITWVITRGTKFKTGKVSTNTNTKAILLMGQLESRYSLRENASLLGQGTIAIGQVAAALPYFTAKILMKNDKVLPKPVVSITNLIPRNMAFSSAPALMTKACWAKHGANFLTWATAFDKVVRTKRNDHDASRVKQIVEAVYNSDQYGDPEDTSSARAKIVVELNWM